MKMALFALVVLGINASASPQTKFEYDCENRPFAHTYFSRPGYLGVCSATVEGKTFLHTEKNVGWALWSLAQELCVREKREILALPYECNWVKQ